MKTKKENIIMALVFIVITAGVVWFIAYTSYTSKNITLKYTDVPEEKTEFTEITNDSIGTMLSEEAFGDVTIFSYLGKDTKTMRLGGFKLGGKLYSVGSVALNTTDANNYSAGIADINGVKYYKISGSLVSGDRTTRYYDLSGGTPKLVLAVPGTISETDFDGDKNTEIISSTSSYLVKVYKVSDGKVTVADISKQTGAAAATYNAASNLFIVMPDLNNTDDVKMFAFTDGKLRIYKNE